MLTISSHRIPVQRNRLFALVIHYCLKTIFFFAKLLSLKFISKEAPLPVENIKKILVIRIDGLGDIAMSAPAFKGIRQAFPGSHITLLAAGESKTFVEAMSTFDEIVYFNAPWIVKGKKNKYRHFFKGIKSLRNSEFDLCIDLRGDFRDNILMYLFRAEYRMGFDICGCGFLLTHVIPCQDNHHSTVLSFCLNDYLGLKDSSAYDLSLPLTGKDPSFATDFLEQNISVSSGARGPVVIIQPAAKWHGRRWLSHRFAEIADSLIEKLNATVILSGSIDDLWLVDEIAGFMNQVPVIAAGKTSLLQFISLLEKSDLLVGLDSGPAHIAASMSLRSVTLYGPARAEAVGPYGDEHIVVTKQDDFPCSPCAQNKCEKPDNSCMHNISVNDVWQAVEKQIERIQV